MLDRPSFSDGRGAAHVQTVPLTNSSHTPEPLPRCGSPYPATSLIPPLDDRRCSSRHPADTPRQRGLPGYEQQHRTPTTTVAIPQQPAVRFPAAGPGQRHNPNRRTGTFRSGRRPMVPGVYRIDVGVMRMPASRHERSTPATNRLPRHRIPIRPGRSSPPDSDRCAASRIDATQSRRADPATGNNLRQPRLDRLDLVSADRRKWARSAPRSGRFRAADAAQAAAPDRSSWAVARGHLPTRAGVDNLQGGRVECPESAAVDDCGPDTTHRSQPKSG